jgi:hypothetical protein
VLNPVRHFATIMRDAMHKDSGPSRFGETRRPWGFHAHAHLAKQLRLCKRIAERFNPVCTSSCRVGKLALRCSTMHHHHGAF